MWIGEESRGFGFGTTRMMYVPWNSSVLLSKISYSRNNLIELNMQARELRMQWTAATFGEKVE